MSIILYGYHYSVYTRIVRMVLGVKSIAYHQVEVDPFADDPDPAHIMRHPFGKVPVIEHDDFRVYETAAICRYLERSWTDRSLTPYAPRDQARMEQIIAIIDNYGYWPLIRQVYAQRVFRVAEGGTPDEEIISQGIAGAYRVFSALEDLIDGGAFLVGDRLSMADLHLGAMMAYFTASPDGRKVLRDFPRLAAWWGQMSETPYILASDPGLPGKAK